MLSLFDRGDLTMYNPEEEHVGNWVYLDIEGEENNIYIT